MGCNASKRVETRDTDAQTADLRFLDRRCSESLEDTLTTAYAMEPKRRKVTHVCLTGGPCAGKSTALTMLQTKLPQWTGVKVFCVPEAASLMVSGGLDWADCTSVEIRIEYQLALLRTQLALEDTFLQVARACGKPCVVVSDRGTMDGRAFCSEKEFNELLARGGYTLEHLRDTRYDMVIHMVTAAKGAESHYNLDNPARQEAEPEDARKADERLRNVYIGHRNVKVVDNSTPFDVKLNRVYDAVLEACGQVPVPHHRTRRFLTKLLDESEITVPFVHMTVTVTVLAGSTEDNIKIIMLRQEGSTEVHIYQHLTSRDGGVIKVEHRISSREYFGLLLQRDPDREDVIKKNVSFMWENSYYECGAFVTPERFVGLAMIYVECSEGEPLPPFIHGARDVTNDAEYSSFAMSYKPRSVESPHNGKSAAASLDATLNGTLSEAAALNATARPSKEAKSPRKATSPSSDGNRI